MQECRQVNTMVVIDRSHLPSEETTLCKPSRYAFSRIHARSHTQSQTSARAHTNARMHTRTLGKLVVELHEIRLCSCRVKRAKILLGWYGCSAGIVVIIVSTVSTVSTVSMAVMPRLLQDSESL